jgi:hypothetical protein
MLHHTPVYCIMEQHMCDKRLWQDRFGMFFV